jgi:hypothetical protein
VADEAALIHALGANSSGLNVTGFFAKATA